ncbi:transposase [Acidovorax sp. SD340]|nr:transposase [Acidovorax sp. SD340]
MLSPYSYHIEPGAKILTDGLASYPLAAGSDYVHRSTSIKGPGMDAHEILPGVHRVASLVKRWLLGTHQGSFSADHMQAYLDEFTFRFNPRGSRARGMLFYRLLEQSVAMHPISCRDLVANPGPRKAGEDSPAPPCSAKSAPSSLHLEIPRSPWRR